MSRKSLLLCLAVLVMMLLGLGVAIAFLYAGTGESRDRGSVSYGGAGFCVSAVPSDAVLISFFSRLEDACRRSLAGFEFPSALLDGMEEGTLASLKKCPLAVSLHYSGKLCALYVIEVKKASEDAVDAVLALSRDRGLYSEKKGDYILMSRSETVLKSALRHLDKGVSIADVRGFAAASSSVGGNSRLLLPSGHVKRLMTEVFSNKVVRYSSFMERVADWFSFEIGRSEERPLYVNGALLYDGDADEFISVMEDQEPAVTRISDVLPSYTMFALSFPVSDIGAYISSYNAFVDSRQGLQNLQSMQKSLGKKAGIMPAELFAELALKEIGTASFVVGGKVETVNMFRVGNKDVELMFKGCDVKSLKNYRPCVHQWAYPSFASSVFGKLFAIADESCFTYHDGWLITGSQTAIEEFVDKDALNYTLTEYLDDAGKGGLLSDESSIALAYFSFTQDPGRLQDYLRPEALSYMMERVGDCDLCPAVFRLTKEKKQIAISLDVHALTLKKTKAPLYDRDTVVVVPEGPFAVKNSHTGKMNTFYQNAQNAICLRDENGKDLWGVPLGKSICGTAHNVDYYANGKLQIIFGAGSDVYIIDRLGRYVSGFPMDLGRDILIGPDLYDFNGTRKYNILVLHKDNTIEMYNLKGRKPESWKGITAAETIKALPERLTIGGNDFWVVRTSIQTLIFPFYGGDALTVFDGDDKIRPDSNVKVSGDDSVEVSCYDGKTRTIKLR